jgi:hypothetical protein
MYFYVDESGHTGANLFDDTQPILYYGVLSSQLNIDGLARDAVKELRASLGVERLHANELGMGKLVEISKGLIFLQENLDLRFDFHTVYKPDHALICFFDQVFDQGINPSVPWTAYWTPLRYILLWKVAILFDVETLKKAWNARIQKNDELATKEFLDVCKTILTRLEVVPDERSRQIIGDALAWAMENPQELQYNTKSKRESYWITPNLIGFQHVMQSIALRIKDGKSKSPVIVVDQQTQFNKTQRSLAEYYAEASGRQFDFGTGLPEIDFTGMPVTPILFQSGLDNVGLELVDIYLWLFKRLFEGKEIAPELHPLLAPHISNGMYNEISLNAIAERWTEWFENLPELTPEQWESGKQVMETDEKRRLNEIAASKQRQKLMSALK